MSSLDSGLDIFGNSIGQQFDAYNGLDLNAIGGELSLITPLGTSNADALARATAIPAINPLTPANVNPFAPATGGWLSDISTAINSTLGIGTPNVVTQPGLFDETSGQTIPPVKVTKDPPPSAFSQFKPWNPLGTAGSASNPFGTPAKASVGPSIGLLLLAGIVVAAIVLMTGSSGGKK